MGDRISAMLVQAQEGPFYGLEWIIRLLEVASSPTRHESYPALEALRDIFILILPPKVSGRSLTPWTARPMTDDKELTPAWFLLLAYFEDRLLKVYGDFLKLLEIALHDQVSNGRERAMRIVYELAIAYKSDHEETLLVLLVNKLGDPQRKISSRAAYYLQCVAEKHVELTLTIVKAVQSVATQPDAPNDKQAYYGLTLFSQLQLSESAPEVTAALLMTYQHFLELLLAQLDREVNQPKRRRPKAKRSKTSREEEDDDEQVPRTTKVALRGLTRAIPFARSTGQSGLDRYSAKLLAIAARIRCFSTLLQAAELIYKVANEAESAGAGGGQALLQLLSELVNKHLLNYARMGETTSMHPQLLKLLYRIFCSLGESADPKAIDCLRAMTKTLLSTSTLVNNPAFAAAALLLVNEVLSVRPGLRLAICFPDDADGAGGESSPSLLTELNILSRHFHPTVARYAATLLLPKGEIDVSHEPDDPFECMGNTSFLEKLISAAPLS